ncbi:retinol dehydrogenase 13-like isoform X2 [Zootermopsis nevadensis]|uniref:retinol dehydrogenase 13-like isoform X2 n=1 Tax=Zootermopsis nevadensis TaxID=136037 RepID=UPI000B8ECCA9|nr:retinol dehydrogenase 13-like isoform X2 [Zootermopsis nevadensis]
MVSCSRYSGTVRLDGKTAIVTGSNTGIGKFTALDFVKRGARVIMACRSVEKAEAAAEQIRGATRDLKGAGAVDVVKLDLGSLTSVRQCADQLLRAEQRVHLLVNNADGNMNFDDLNLENSYGPVKAYNQSKLANVLFSNELARRLEGTGVTTYSVHPGVVRTELGRHLNDTYFRGLRSILGGMGALFFKTAEDGAQTTIYCSLDEKLTNKTGLYYSECREKAASRRARDPEAAKKLWDLSAKMAGLGNWDPFTADDGETPS